MPLDSVCKIKYIRPSLGGSVAPEFPICPHFVHQGWVGVTIGGGGGWCGSAGQEAKLGAHFSASGSGLAMTRLPRSVPSGPGPPSSSPRPSAVSACWWCCPRKQTPPTLQRRGTF